MPALDDSQQRWIQYVAVADEAMLEAGFKKASVKNDVIQ
jgi:hypothetical protein